VSKTGIFKRFTFFKLGLNISNNNGIKIIDDEYLTEQMGSGGAVFFLEKQCIS
jgi:hypothetical protein